MDIPTKWTAAKQRIESGATMPNIKNLLESLSEWELATIYTDGKNMLHFAIANNRKDVLEYLFEKHTCLPQSATVPYMHVACAYGFKRIVELLVEERPEEEFSIIAVDDPHWMQFIASHPYHYNENDELCTRMASLLEKKKMISAYEVAALYQQAECLRTLLDELDEDEWLSKMVVRDQALVLEMMLATMDFDEDDLTKGFNKALDTKSHVCLEILLRFAAKQGKTVTDPYHSLYNEGNWYKDGSAVECTKVLIRYGYNVNRMTEKFTYPLYIFLQSLVDTCQATKIWDLAEPEKFLKDASACLAELLAAGADPNFNEKTRTKSRKASKTIKKDGSRRSYSSALDLLGTEIYETRCPESLEFDLLIQCIPLLVKYGCNLSWSDANGDSFLHKLMHSSADTVYMWEDNESKDLSMFRRAVGIVLSNGGDFQAVNRAMAMPFTVFLDRLVEIITQAGMNVNARQKFYKGLLERVKRVCSFLHVMELGAVCIVVKSGIEAVDSDRCSSAPAAFRNGMKKELLLYARSVKTLYQTSLIRVWRSSGRKLANLECLEIPSHVVQDLEKMLHLTGHD